MIKSIFITLAVALALFGCGDSSGSPGVPDFTGNVADFTAWLDKQPANTAASPYIIEMNISDESIFETLKATLKSDKNENKYVYLDLSGSTVTTIPDAAFCTGTQPALWTGCATLIGITIPNNVTSIGGTAFLRCTSLATINVAAGNTAYIAENGILYNKAKTILLQYPAGKASTSFTIPGSVTSIGEVAFASCANLKNVTIGNSVTGIGGWAFYECTSLTDITIPDSVTSIGDSAFIYCTSLTSVTIGNSVTSIGWSAFYYCTSLTSVTIGNSVTSIGSGAFGYTNLTSVTIPNSVTSIGGSAFYDCTSLISVTFAGTIPSSGFYDYFSFPGDLYTKFYETDADNGTPGTYTRVSGGSTWTKK